ADGMVVPRIVRGVPRRAWPSDYRGRWMVTVYSGRALHGDRDGRFLVYTQPTDLSPDRFVGQRARLPSGADRGSFARMGRDPGGYPRRRRVCAVAVADHSGLSTQGACGVLLTAGNAAPDRVSGRRSSLGGAQRTLHARGGKP